jgi:hypothetical protein
LKSNNGERRPRRQRTQHTNKRNRAIVGATRRSGLSKLDTYLINCKPSEFNKSAFKLQNIEQEISNFEVLAKAIQTSAVRNSLFDILNFKYFYLGFLRLRRKNGNPTIVF